MSAYRIEIRDGELCETHRNYVTRDRFSINSRFCYHVYLGDAELVPLVEDINPLAEGVRVPRRLRNPQVRMTHTRWGARRQAKRSAAAHTKAVDRQQQAAKRAEITQPEKFDFTP